MIRRITLLFVLVPLLASCGEIGLRFAASPGKVPSGTAWISLGRGSGAFSLKARLGIGLLSPWTFRDFGLGFSWKDGNLSLRGSASLSPRGLEVVKCTSSLSMLLPPGQAGLRANGGISLEVRNPLGNPLVGASGFLSLRAELEPLYLEARRTLPLYPPSPGRGELDLSYRAAWGELSWRNTFGRGWEGSSLDFSWGGDVVLRGYVGVSPGGIQAVVLRLQGFLGDARWGVEFSWDPGHGLRPPSLSFTGKERDITFSLWITTGLLPQGVTLELRRGF